MKTLLPGFFLLLALSVSLPAEGQIFRRKAKKAKTETPAPPELPAKTPEAPPKTPTLQEAPPPKTGEAPMEAAPQETATSSSKPASTPAASNGQTPPAEEFPIISRPEGSPPYGEPVVQQKPNGSIHWTDQYIEAKGSAVIDTERFTNPAQARLMAIRGATVVAQRNLLEIVNGVNVVGETTVQDMMTINDLIITRVEGLIRGAQLVGDPREQFGTMEVTLRMPLYGPDGLANTVHEEATNLNKQYKTGGDYNTGQAVAQAAASLVAGETPAIAFRMNGRTIDPSMFPVILDEKGNLVFDLTRIYDPRTGGRFPQILQTTREMFNAAGYSKGVEVIDVIDSFEGKLVVDSKQARRINWGRIGRIAASVGSVLLTIL
jgi:hypothetical protein